MSESPATRQQNQNYPAGNARLTSQEIWVLLLKLTSPSLTKLLVFLGVNKMFMWVVTALLVTGMEYATRTPSEILKRLCLPRLEILGKHFYGFKDDPTPQRSKHHNEVVPTLRGVTDFFWQAAAKDPSDKISGLVRWLHADALHIGTRMTRRTSAVTLCRSMETTGPWLYDIIDDELIEDLDFMRMVFDVVNPMAPDRFIMTLVCLLTPVWCRDPKVQTNGFNTRFITNNDVYQHLDIFRVTCENHADQWHVSWRLDPDAPYWLRWFSRDCSADVRRRKWCFDNMLRFKQWHGFVTYEDHRDHKFG